MSTPHSPLKAEVFDLFTQHVSSGKVAFFQSAGIDFVMGRREGPFIWDLDGAKRLINCHCNGGVYNLGHRHPALVQTLVESLQTLDIGNHHLVSAPRAALAGRLAELTGLPYTVFAVGGGEAIDLAIKVARGATGRQKIVSASGGYHGHTGYALHTGDDKYFAPFGPRLPGFVQVPFGDADALAAAVDRDTAAADLRDDPGHAGHAHPAARLSTPRRGALCDQHGALLILDEIQAGLGRTGRLWGLPALRRPARHAGDRQGAVGRDLPHGRHLSAR
jgi:putrescine aminotransferase